jgi:hypothetical protein
VAVPDAPTDATATAGARRATVTFVPPAVDGGFIITSYTVTAVDETTPANGGQTASAANPPIAVTGLTNDETYHFTVKATNSAGQSVASANSNSVVILDPRAPDAPIAISATGGNAQATVSFSPPADNGGSAITGYTVTAIDETNPGNGGQTSTGASSPRTVTGLTNGDGYTFRVTATNAQGTSVPSAKSALVIPVAPGSSDTPPPPFANAASFPLEKPVNLVQLQDEISAAAGLTVQAAVAGDYDPMQPISPTNDATLWVAPDTVSSGLIITAITNHVVNPAYGISDVDLQFQAVLQKLVHDNSAVLTADELQAAVRGLTLRTLLPGGGF